MEDWIFWPTAVVSLGSAMLMLMTPNAVHSALALVVNFFTLAVLYLLLDAHFLAAAQVIVYAGAIMVLFLFVIMLLGVDREEDLRETIRGHLVASSIAGGALGFLLVWLTLRSAAATIAFKGLEQANSSGNVEGLGRTLFTKFLFPFEVTSILLIVAAIGAIVIGQKRNRDVPERNRDVTERERDVTEREDVG